MPRSTARDLVGALDAVADLARERRIPVGVPQRDLRRLARGLEPLARVLADRLQHPEPVALAIHLHERLVDERLELVEAWSRRALRRRPRHLRGCTRRRIRPCAGRDAAPTPSAASGSSRSWRAASAAARECRGTGREHVEGVVQPLEQRLRGEEPQPCGSELERKRQTVQAAADRPTTASAFSGVSANAASPLALARRTARRPGSQERLGRAGVVEDGSASGAAGIPVRRRSAAASGW